MHAIARMGGLERTVTLISMSVMVLTVQISVRTVRLVLTLPETICVNARVNIPEFIVRLCLISALTTLVTATERVMISPQVGAIVIQDIRGVYVQVILTNVAKQVVANTPLTAPIYLGHIGVIARLVGQVRTVLRKLTNAPEQILFRALAMVYVQTPRDPISARAFPASPGAIVKPSRKPVRT